MRILLTLLAFAQLGAAQITWTDYDRALNLRTKYRNLVVGEAGPANWLPNSDEFWYRVSTASGDRFVLVDAKTLHKQPAFDHEKLAAALTRAGVREVTAGNLPFTTFQYRDSRRAIAFEGWRCSLTSYSCQRAAAPGPGRAMRPPEDRETNDNSGWLASPAEPENDVEDGVEYPSPQAGGAPPPIGASPSIQTKTSPDGKWDALIRNFNVFVREHNAADPAAGTFLSLDGSEGDYYTFRTLAWSPDSTHLVAYRVRPGYRREVHYIESSPTDQLQPKYSSRVYAKPGDALDIPAPVLFDFASKREIAIDNALFPNPYNLTQPVWRKSGRAFTFEYNRRGHQMYRVIEVNAATGRARAVITEETNTFIDYRPLVPNQRDTGKKFRYDLDDGREIVWMSERDGWAHLYLYDGVSGRVKNQITKGDWVVRSVEHVDEKTRRIWFGASGMYPGEDPYFVYYYRIDFDGTGLTRITEAPGNHSAVFSPDMKYYVDEWSTVSQPSVTQLRRTGDNSLAGDLEHADPSKLYAAGWKAPEVFTAKGRDGKTDIWGVIWRPPNLDPAKHYPVVESIYAGPQGSFVPKTFSASVQPLTELGFIVVQMDGMGTNNRSKAFHDMAFRNLKDAGFDDRILWHKAVAAKYPYYDLTRVGVFGTSAGGQNAMGAMLFHPEFYKAAVANSGCHDNRMDKIWWNEQWMSWPIGPQYAESSNVDNAYRLQGKLLLVVGEMDDNVDPSSTFQVVNALTKANKKFDLLYVPGGGHGSGGTFGEELLFDFFVHNLEGIEPPKWEGPAAVPPQARY
ncbi:MAG: DPP IV N-terminal domain-containing protein [Acidobacteriota bacterium]|nr:DPP IV N-terminal domain-containing protein [Acidobacteriota bacterium]